MIKTGFISLIIHGAVSIATFFAFSILINFVGIVNLLFKNDELIYQIASRTISIPLFVCAVFLYFVLGRMFLPRGSKLQSTSVFIVSFIGIALWMVSFNLSSGVIKDIGQDLNWILYCLYNAYFFPILVTFNIKSSYSIAVFSIFPSLLLFVGSRFSKDITINTRIEL